MASRSNGGTQCKLEECIAIVCHSYELEPAELLKRGRMRKPSEARAVVAWLVRKYGSETLTDVARKFDRDVATMSTAVRRLETKMIQSEKFRKMVTLMERSSVFT